MRRSPSILLALLVGRATGPSQDVNDVPFSEYLATIKTIGEFNVYSVLGVTISSGDFVLGLRIDHGPSKLPGALDGNSG